MIIGILLTIILLIALWELIYLSLFVFSLPTRKPINNFSPSINDVFQDRQDAIIPEWDNGIEPNITQITLPEPPNSDNQCYSNDSVKKQFNKCAPISMRGTPLFKLCTENGETYYYKKNDNYTRLFFPHDAPLWLFSIISKVKRWNNQKQIKP